MSENLSQQLFRPRLDASECSRVANSKAHLNEAAQQDAQRPWYRMQRPWLWQWMGMSWFEIQSRFASIAMSEASRTSVLLDTVEGYQNGNWCYEFNQLASRHFERSKGESESMDSRYKHSLKAAFYANLASFPHLRGDSLASSALTLANNYLDAAVAHSPYLMKKITVEIDGKPLHCQLHLPDDDNPKPLVIVSGGIDSTQIELYPIFQNYLAPRGIAMLCVDLPGVASASHWPLQQDSSRLHLAILDHLVKVPWVDETRVAVLGYRFAGNVAARMAFLAPDRLKAAVILSSPVHHIFSKREAFMALPQMYRDCLANRMGMDGANVEQVFYKAMPLSLKTQGLLGTSRTSLPLYVVGRKDDYLSPESDLRLLSQASRNSEVRKVSNLAQPKRFDSVFTEVMLWLEKRL